MARLDDPGRALVRGLLSPGVLGARGIYRETKVAGLADRVLFGQGTLEAAHRVFCLTVLELWADSPRARELWLETA